MIVNKDEGVKLHEGVVIFSCKNLSTCTRKYSEKNFAAPDCRPKEMTTVATPPPRQP